MAEEWAHHAMHYGNYRWRYFQYVRRRHLYHHSRHGVGTAYGITSDFWDKVFGTRIPLPQRGPPAAARARAGPHGRRPAATVTGPRALVTGASRGLGREMARQLAGAGSASR